MIKNIFKITNNYIFFSRHFFTTFNLDLFKSNDYKTLCLLLKQKVPIYNEEMEVLTDIKLLDQNNKLIGIYTSPEARKKAISMNKDIILLNDKTKPVLCKAISFRQTILQKFFDQIITKRNQTLINQASSIRNIKLNPALNINQLKIKARQISELAKKHSKVRIYMTLKNTTMDEGLQKFDLLKSLIQNSCRILEQVDVWNMDQSDLYQQDRQLSATDVKTISMMIKSSQNELAKLLQQSSKDAPEKAIINFLKRFYKQQDTDLKDMKFKFEKNQFKSQGQLDNLIGLLGIDKTQQKQQLRAKQLQKIRFTRIENKKAKILKTPQQIQRDKKKITIDQSFKSKNIYQGILMQEAQSRIMNERLKKLLNIYETM